MGTAIMRALWLAMLASGCTTKSPTYLTKLPENEHTNTIANTSVQVNIRKTLMWHYQHEADKRERMSWESKMRESRTNHTNNTK